MIVIALLFAFIIVLLWVIVRLLQTFFATYSDVYFPTSTEKVLKKKSIEELEKQAYLAKFNTEISNIVNKRFLEMETKLTPSSHKQDCQTADAEALAETFSQAVKTYITLLKAKTNSTSF